jgi:hypothetical protein
MLKLVIAAVLDLIDNLTVAILVDESKEQHAYVLIIKRLTNSYLCSTAIVVIDLGL